MRADSILSRGLALAAAATWLPGSAACPGALPAAGAVGGHGNGPRQEGGGNPLVYGPDEHPDPETAGWNLNHVSLIVRNMTASIDFYSRVLGMTHMFSLNAHPKYKLAYLGHPAGGRNGSAYVPPAELFRLKNNVQGLVELLSVAPAPGDPQPRRPEASMARPNTLSHIGLIVPDPAAAQERFRRLGVPIVKEWNADFPSDSPRGALANAYGLGLLPEVEAADALGRDILATLAFVAKATLMVADPDGNVIEVQPLVESLSFNN